MQPYNEMTDKQKTSLAKQLISQLETIVLSNFPNITVIDTYYSSTCSRLLTYVEFSNKMIVWVTGESNVNVNFDVRLYSSKDPTYRDYTCIVATCENCTPEEFQAVYNDLIQVAPENAYDYIADVLHGNVY